MAQQVVLIRHGEAKGKKVGQTDFERELTDKGAKALAKAFPQALSLAKPTRRSELWVSTAVRAQQTAQIANQTLGIATVRNEDYLYDQDQDQFVKDLRSSRADLVVVVGHIPFMEDACALLCGTYLGFSTGAVACVSLGQGGRGRLEWFVQGPSA